MSWQSFYICFNTNKQVCKILYVVLEHNNYYNIHQHCEENDFNEEPGEELFDISYCEVLKHAPRSYCINGKYCLLFGAGGGRDQTYRFFMARDVQLQCFTQEVAQYLDIKQQQCIQEFPDKEVNKLAMQIESLNKQTTKDEIKTI